MRDATPMMAQYRALKAKHQDALLFFRLGDFYELFFEDAVTGSKELGITLTGRDAGDGERAPMCGVPHHSVDDYIKTLIDKGFKVAICDQVEDPSVAKGLVKRDVTRVITPGTYWEGAEAASSTYIASLVGAQAGICACDVSTGEVLLASFSEDGPGGTRAAVEELARLFPRECVVPDGRRFGDLRKAVERSVPGVFITSVPEDSFGTPQGEWPVASRVYGPATVDSLAAQGRGPALQALEGLLSYLTSTQMIEMRHLKEPVLYLDEGFMEVDRSTRRNLELLERLQGGREGTLSWVLDRCCTAMGSRLMKQWIQRPLKDAVRIEDRLVAVDRIFSDSALRENLRERLSRVKDLERLVTRIAYKSCNARDLVAVAASLEAVPDLKKLLVSVDSPLLQDVLGRLDGVPEVVRGVRDTLVSDPPLSVTDGYLVREGFSPEVDQLREQSTGGKKWLADFETAERERTGVRNLKVGFNRVFGYYIEVSRSNASMVPDHYVRRQTLSTGERFVTPELRAQESAILGAEEKLFKEEYRVFCEVRDFIGSCIRRIQRTARAVTELDALASFAQVALENNYVRPTVYAAGDTIIKDSRHPVLEKVLPPGAFVPNDITFDQKQRVLVITGPNMGGKSTYCRQAALTVLMAQMGSYVPARSCSISCADKLFARVGAYDDLVLGQSTFMVEMSEVSRILKGATKDSLVILDEIGRGTSTFDGLAVAWAVLEHLTGDVNGSAEGPSGPRALVATHYRELTLLADLRPSVANYAVSVKKRGDEVVFLRKVGRGVAEGSFGIEVSAMAGLPASVVRRAREILLGLEAEARKGARWKSGILGQVASRGAGFLTEPLPGQGDLFGSGSQAASALSPEMESLLRDLRELDIDHMSPMEALEKLYQVKKRLAGGEET